MKVLVTGSSGFVGKNVVSTLKSFEDIEVLLFDRDDTEETLEDAAQNCDFVVHLAGVNRPDNVSEFYEGNASLTEKLCALLEKHKNIVPILITSSIQATLDNDYGKSKKDGEIALLHYAQKHSVPVMIYRLPNLFGKWSRPFYNSVVSTWCHQIARDEPITVSNPDYELTLVYIDDLVSEIVSHIRKNVALSKDHYYEIETKETLTLRTLEQTLRLFKQSRDSLVVANMDHPFVKKLYSTYLTYLPTDQFSYPLTQHQDQRGSFTEIVKAPEFGQVSVNISKPGITKGNHWHHTKTEKFLVVKGCGVIQFRDIFETEVIEYHVSDEKLEVVDIPPGYTHNIINTGDADMVTIMWCNESFDPQRPDTFFLEV
ncbi:capsular biosynthesis protein [Erysipelothrix larvae]|uniref:Capsular biosynthesis protein n=1 Tax=Erysipelothrix larvae TaxID=1514105 RepID=A0A109UGL2_9FIRM|nr:NAD-dependent epimerase/dehydratase family protein [Erysipelothrix larvae]AMC92897.1 capsular biosynthesis protein [Erysipelothrix larvae]